MTKRNFDTTHATKARLRPVIMTSYKGKETFFSSIKEASEKTGLHRPCICRCCRGTQEYTGGFKFRYGNEGD